MAGQVLDLIEDLTEENPQILPREISGEIYTIRGSELFDSVDPLER